jgi:hypothetical protein
LVWKATAGLFEGYSGNPFLFEDTCNPGCIHNRFGPDCKCN